MITSDISVQNSTEVHSSALDSIFSRLLNKAHFGETYPGDIFDQIMRYLPYENLKINLPNIA